MSGENQFIIAGMLTGKKYFCQECGSEVKGFKDSLSAREFKVTRLCQNCQDEIFIDDKD